MITTSENQSRHPDLNRVANQNKARQGASFRGRDARVKLQCATERDGACQDRNKPCYGARVRPIGLSPREVAEMLRTTLGRVYRLCRGPLDAWPHGPGGRQLRIDPASLAAYQRVR